MCFLRFHSLTYMIKPFFVLFILFFWGGGGMHVPQKVYVHALKIAQLDFGLRLPET